MVSKTALLLCGASAFCGHVVPAFAQDTAGTRAGTAARAAADASSPIASGRAASTPAQAAAGEIVVTANKREQNLSKVGLSITALGSQELAIRRIANVADLAQATPGLVFAPTPDSTPVYTLRGVGFFESSLSAYPDVSLYIDQAPLSLPAEAALTAFDLERVEVLKGPQGTLFGNNATGGAINFVAAKPTNHFAAGGEIGYGRFNTVDVSGFVSGSLTDTLSARLAVKAVKGDDWQKSYTRDDTIGKQNNVAGRFILDWKPSDRLKFSLNLNGWRDRDDPTVPQDIAVVPQNPTPPIPVLSFPFAPNNARAADWSATQRPFQNNHFKQATLRGDYNLGGVTLTSLTGLSDLKMRSSLENDGTPYHDTDSTGIEGHVKSFTQEARLSNGAGSRLRWVVGGNYERTTVFENTQVDYGDSTSTTVLGIVRSGYLTDSKMRNYAGFGNLEYDITDKLTLKGGIRRTHAVRDFYAYNSDQPDSIATSADLRPGTGAPTLTLTDFFNGVYGAVYGNNPDGSRVVPLIQPFGSIILDTDVNPDGTPVNPSTYLTAGAVNQRLSENNTSWSVGLDYKPTSTLLLYLNASKGYKAGGFPHLSGSLDLAYDAVKQESVLDVEGGFKAQLFNRKLSINGAGFSYDYRDKQLRAKFVDPIFGALDRLVNVPKSRITGGELEIQARPMRGLSLSASGTYVDAHIDKYQGTIGTQVTVVNGQNVLAPITASFAGASLPFAPKFQYSVRADYDFPVADNLNAFLGVGVNGQSKSIGILTISEADKKTYEINARALVSLNAGIRASSNRWRLTFWGKNIFNKYYWTNTIQTYDTIVRYAGRPAEYGVALGFNF